MKAFFIAFFVYAIFITSSMGQVPFESVQRPNSEKTAQVVNSIRKFTGQLSLNIPLYDYKSIKSNVHVSVGLSYIGGGVKRNDQFSLVGAGWGLIAGGEITRVINGMPDDINVPGTPKDNYVKKGYAFTYLIEDNPCPVDYVNVGSYSDKYRENKINRDSEADWFEFNFEGKQGAFVIPKHSSLNGGEIKIATIPQSNLEIIILKDPLPSNIKTEISGFKIKDQDGLVYTFSAIEKVRKKVCDVEDGGGNYYRTNCSEPDEYYIISWKLTKIEDSNSVEVVNFLYEEYNMASGDGSTTM